MLVAEGADTAGVHDQGGLGEGLSDPTDGEGAEDVAVADDHDVAGDMVLLGLSDDGPVVLVADLGDQVVDARDDVLGALAAGTPVAPDVPRPQPRGAAPRPDLRRRDPLVRPVVPLRNPRRDRHRRRRVVRRRLFGGFRARAAVVAAGCRLPRVWVVAAEIEELDRSLRAVPR